MTIHVTEYEDEPVPGLPGIPPAGERILWQGKPDAKALAAHAFHTRLVAGYFGLLAIAALAFAVLDGHVLGLAMTLLAGVTGVGLLHLLAWATARSAIYTLTDKRIVLRIGIALPKCINLPLSLVSSVDLHRNTGGTGDVALTIAAAQKLGYLALWPHARAWRLAKPQPMLRAIPDAERVGALVARACLAANPGGQVVALQTSDAAAMPIGGAVAA